MHSLILPVYSGLPLDPLVCWKIRAVDKLSEAVFIFASKLIPEIALYQIFFLLNYISVKAVKEELLPPRDTKICLYLCKIYLLSPYDNYSRL